MSGFTSTAGDGVNAERAAEVGREMQKKLDEQSVTLTMEIKFEVKTLSSLRKIPKLNEKIHLDSIRLFNQLIIVAQRDNMTLEASLGYELTLCLCSVTETIK